MLPWLNAPMLYFALCALLGFVALGCEVHGHSRGVDDTRAEYMEQVIEATAEARQFEQRRATLIQESDDAKDAELRNITARADAIAAGLRERTDNRLSGASASACSGATGSQLSRLDAEFLVRLARRADEQRAELAACQERERAGQ